MIQQQVEQSIRSKSVLEFAYSGHRRIVEPHVLGVSDGAMQFLGYQIGRSSGSGGIPEWRRFELSKVSGLSISEDNFPACRNFPSGRHSSWDRQILVVDA